MVNSVEVKEKYQVKNSNKSAASENVDGNVNNE
jgi:hypothetical protein